MRILIILIVLAFTAQLEAIIHEIRNIEEVVPYVDGDTLLMWDIDNTLIEPAQDLGNDQWVRHRWKQLRNLGLTNSEAKEQMLFEWRAVQHLTKMTPVEPTTADIVKQLHVKAASVMGMTTRGIGVATVTVHQLHSVGIDLSMVPPIVGDIYFDNGHGILYREGIFFTSGTHKGSAITRLWELGDICPNKVVFVNDKHDNIVPVERACEALGIPFIGLRYGYLDEKVRSFKPEVAEIQWAEFGRLLSNGEAEAILREAG